MEKGGRVVQKMCGQSTAHTDRPNVFHHSLLHLLLLLQGLKGCVKLAQGVLET